MKKTLQDIQVKYDEPISIFCDNTSAISISKNPVMHSKTKHIPIKFHFLWEQVTEKNIKLEYIGTKEQIADIFTKPLPRETFEYLRQETGSSSCPTLIHMTFCKEDRGRKIIRGSYPFPLMSKGERNIKIMKTGGEMVTGGV
jgi:hypothetical protein